MRLCCVVVVVACLQFQACSSEQPPDLPSGGSVPSVTQPDSNMETTSLPLPPVPDPAEPVAVFISGHSLVEEPLPQYLVEIARSAGRTLEWNKQTGPGSPIIQRSRGNPPGADPLAGFRFGMNRGGNNLDVLDELRAPRTVAASRYDILLITEQHGALGNLLWNDTGRALRGYHDRFIEANARGQTFFFEPWLNIDQLDDPRRWIDFTRRESRVWGCITSTINASLEAQGRSDRVINIPAGVAIAELLERAVSEPGVPGITAENSLQTVRRVFSDDVHLTDLGVFYIALVTHGAIFRAEPTFAELQLPVGVTPELSRRLSEIAWEFVSRYFNPYRPVAAAACRDVASGEFSSEYWSYFRDIRFAREEFAPLAYARAWRLDRRWRKTVELNDATNPLVIQ
jgi:hypothetical protein